VLEERTDPPFSDAIYKPLGIKSGDIYPSADGNNIHGIHARGLPALAGRELRIPFLLCFALDFRSGYAIFI
jgi:hypothetical protein